MTSYVEDLFTPFFKNAAMSRSSRETMSKMGFSYHPSHDVHRMKENVQWFLHILTGQMLLPPVILEMEDFNWASYQSVYALMSSHPILRVDNLGLPPSTNSSKFSLAHTMANIVMKLLDPEIRPLPLGITPPELVPMTLVKSAIRSALDFITSPYAAIK
ncbi:hypothetical protein BDK51DRAFT_33686 [Blyttiomyces helicus]|uniref:Uncharacterized protein n=1 Tax=Blyttiomyces helicus TaxID=388810 RepID=A0A4P9VY15_9FUNG|nr:hypothetical protein BDK51DRAFT_33686 [Blyttiomyces helicus]|eukprot:RKO83188.1 hypothetical protein BDK51DRAFT_33686 [Blyttiomyces helicus]